LRIENITFELSRPNRTNACGRCPGYSRTVPSWSLEAFAIKAPVLAVNRLVTDSEKRAERLFAIAHWSFGMVKNPIAHGPKVAWPMPEQDALDVLTLLSLAIRKLDAAVKVASSML
jgi:hypothetical protein